ncbi:MAG TPA: GTPase, partial [Actinomycetota bacterium]|nr:GTPase [Actinomycetota bacterium]
MTGLLRRGSGVSLEDRLRALGEALELARGRLPTEDIEAGEAVLGRASRRLGLGLEATVVALCGATGSGKSSLFNALAGRELSPVGVLRPTTGQTRACVWGPQAFPELLDWLRAAHVHRIESGDRRLDGLVLLDLPDNDSVATEHRLEVDRLVQIVDLLVWITDPQKYA